MDVNLGVCHTKEEHRLRVFENRALRRIFGHKRQEVVGVREGSTVRSFITCTLHQIFLG
jgi:hypothetical protein